MNKLLISQHALYRYMERVLNFDFTELKVLYSLEQGLPSMNYVKDAYFLGWCEEAVGSLGVFRGAMHDRVMSIMTPKQRNMLHNNKNLEDKVVDKDNNLTYVIREDTIVTVLCNGEK